MADNKIAMFLRIKRLIKNEEKHPLIDEITRR